MRANLTITFDTWEELQLVFRTMQHITEKNIKEQLIEQESKQVPSKKWKNFFHKYTRKVYKV